MHIVRAGAVLLGLFFATLVHATAQRTFVSTAGVDNPACSLVAPCRAFAAAITATSPGGEIIALDSGGYGAVTITKSVSIIAPADVYAGISVFSGNGVTVNGSGIDDSLVTIKNAVLKNNGTGVDAALGFAGSMRVTLANSVLVGNTEGAIAAAPVGSVTFTVAHSILTGNTTALSVFANPGQVASILSDGNTITFSSAAAFQFGNGGGAETIFSPGNNAAGYINGPVVGGTLTSCCAL